MYDYSRRQKLPCIWSINIIETISVEGFWIFNEKCSQTTMSTRNSSFRKQSAHFKSEMRIHLLTLAYSLSCLSGRKLTDESSALVAERSSVANVVHLARTKSAAAAAVSDEGHARWTCWWVHWTLTGIAAVRTHLQQMKEVLFRKWPFL
jgi:hypothetical protein